MGIVDRYIQCYGLLKQLYEQYPVFSLAQRAVIACIYTKDAFTFLLFFFGLMNKIKENRERDI